MGVEMIFLHKGEKELRNSDALKFAWKNFCGIGKEQPGQASWLFGMGGGEKRGTRKSFCVLRGWGNDTHPPQKKTKNSTQA